MSRASRPIWLLLLGAIALALEQGQESVRPYQMGRTDDDKARLRPGQAGIDLGDPILVSLHDERAVGGGIFREVAEKRLLQCGAVATPPRGHDRLQVVAHGFGLTE